MIQNLSLAARRLVLAGSAAVLAACGGGGGGGPAPVNNQAPLAAARLQGEAVLQAATMLDASASSDPDGTIASHNWDYGDGVTGSSDVHIYTRTGTFHVVLTVTDSGGATATTSFDVTVAKCSAAGTRASDLSPHQTVCMQTSKGEMVIELFATEAPKTTANFLTYVDEGFYGGTLFHRATGLLIEGGGYTSGLHAKAATHAPVPLESNNGLKNWQYTVAMARDAAPDSATTRFYVNLVDNHQFDFDATAGTPNGNAVFGQLISGTATAEAIGAVATSTQGGLPNVPVQEVVIRSAVKMK